METLYAMLLSLIIFYVSFHIFKRYIFPKSVEADTKEVERNPKWIMKDVKNKYYGFQDIDIVTAETKMFYSLPRLRVVDNKRFELLIPTDTSTKDVNDILRLALMGKIEVKYGLQFRDKPLHWLSILCYMLDGGDIREAATTFEEKKM